ncbi:hypothetical protein KKB99_05315, partial [bacterium]|nr:hypothetical protein [bacterium]MBU1025416.1 hypothetical protein [bacterium]
VNKSDRAGADFMVRSIQSMIELSDFGNGWIPPIVLTQANSDTGMDVLLDNFDKFVAYQKENGHFEKRRRQQLIMEVGDILQDLLRREVQSAFESGVIEDIVLEKIINHESDPYSAAYDLLESRTNLQSN